MKKLTSLACWGGVVLSTTILATRMAAAGGLWICDCSGNTLVGATAATFVPPLAGIVFFLGVLLSERLRLRGVTEALMLAAILAGVYALNTMAFSGSFCPLCIGVWVCATVVVVSRLREVVAAEPLHSRPRALSRMLLVVVGITAGLVWAYVPPNVHPDCDEDKDCCPRECKRLFGGIYRLRLENGYLRCKNPDAVPVPDGKAGCSQQECEYRFYYNRPDCGGPEVSERQKESKICCRPFDRPKPSPQPKPAPKFRSR